MQVVLEDAQESYASEIIVELQSETTEDLEANVARIVEWIQAWRAYNTDAQEDSSEGVTS